jgi:hypothetical protein
MVGFSKEFAASIFGVVEEDQDTNFFEASATRPSAYFENRTKSSTTTMKCHAKLKSAINYNNPTKEANQFLYVSLFTLIYFQDDASPIIRDIYIYREYIYIYMEYICKHNITFDSSTHVPPI